MTVRLLLSFVCLVLVGSARADNWPQWRGPNNDGVSTEKNLPTKWGADKNVAWKLDAARPGLAPRPPSGATASSSPARTATRSSLLCVGTDGKQKWKRDLGAERRTQASARRGQQRLAVALHRRQARLRLRRQRRVRRLRLRRQGAVAVQRPEALRQVPHPVRHALHAGAAQRPPLLPADPRRRRPWSSASTKATARRSGRSSARATAPTRTSTPTPRRSSGATARTPTWSCHGNDYATPTR